MVVKEYSELDKYGFEYFTTRRKFSGKKQTKPASYALFFAALRETKFMRTCYLRIQKINLRNIRNRQTFI